MISPGHLAIRALSKDMDSSALPGHLSLQAEIFQKFDPGYIVDTLGRVQAYLTRSVASYDIALSPAL